MGHNEEKTVSKSEKNEKIGQKEVKKEKKEGEFWMKNDELFYKMRATYGTLSNYSFKGSKCS